MVEKWDNMEGWLAGGQGLISESIGFHIASYQLGMVGLSHVRRE